MNRILESSYRILNPPDELMLPVMNGLETSEKLVTGIADIMRKTAIDSFRADFNNVHFLIINRPGNELKEDANFVNEHFTLIEEHPDFFHISSTKIRQMKDDKDFESIKKLIPEKAFKQFTK